MNTASLKLDAIYSPIYEASYVCALPSPAIVFGNAASYRPTIDLPAFKYNVSIMSNATSVIPVIIL